MRSIGFLFFSIVAGFSFFEQEKETLFTTYVSLEGETTEYIGTEAFFSNTPGIYSIMFNSDEIKCGHHFTNLKEKLTVGTYQVQYEQSPRFGTVCILSEAEKPERLASESGEITIHEVTSGIIEGSFDIVFVGGITGKEYNISGTFTALSMGR